MWLREALASPGGLVRAPGEDRVGRDGDSRSCTSAAGTWSLALGRPSNQFPGTVTPVLIPVPGALLPLRRLAPRVVRCACTISTMQRGSAALGRRVLMNETTARAVIQAHFDASNVSAAGGGPGDDIVRASEIYADDAVVERAAGRRAPARQGEHHRVQVDLSGPP